MMVLKDEQVIVAQATPQGAGAIAMLRVSGSRAVEIVDAVAQFSGTKKLVDQDSHTIHYGLIVDSLGQHVDQVLFLLMRAPKTFTGEHVVEITCHNNQFLIEKIIDIIIQAGARLADQGEFTRRAVLHGKVDLVQAEAINELIHAQTSQALKQSLRQLEGSFSAWIATIEKQLIAVIGYCEASFEFLDEEMNFESQIKERLQKAQADITQVLETFDKRQYVTQGVRIALVGSVNAGKSSLFNALINRQRAIVTDIAGTTRDTIEAGVYREGSFVTFVDTAGLRESHDVVEKIGIDRSFQEVTSCDLILMVFDATATHSQDEINLYQSIAQQHQDKIIFVQNKIDAGNNQLPFLLAEDFISVSVREQKNIDALKIKIDTKIDELMAIGQSPCLLNKRQYNLLLLLDEDLQRITKMIAVKIDYELLAICMNDAISRLSELTGKTVTEDALNAIFREFCVGK
ncbi:tRNA uridine-5-carboxymethylaminomethyl(34) synthesis GTPase MnmE [Candidatus Babeliales bacterium]|nr:tRNA uridine-5-carboxymethylaminomethyl(34) synthesis GTPase MnmE [Candidatus Babeliales bacterium]MBP9843393.1 tRNA uridine-5-carboxymethylaminomethyl(34) synthesis GTPase MnmE [Candidatus Babeliales bacterium]